MFLQEAFVQRTVSPASGPTDISDRVTEEVVIRQAQQADLLDVFRLEGATFPQPWPFSAFESFLGEEGFLVAVLDERVVGYVVSDTTPNYGRDIGHVKDLAIDPDLRQQGLGRTLLHRALHTLIEQGAALAKLEVRTTNEPALELYRSEGFEPLRRIPRYYADGEDAFVMVVDLAEWGQNRTRENEVGLDSPMQDLVGDEER